MISFEDLILMLFPCKADKQVGPSRIFSSEKTSRGISRQRIAEGALLYKYARLKKDSIILEIGTKYGGSAIIMGAALDSGVVYTIDNEPTKQSSKNIEAVKMNINRVIGDAQKIDWSENIGLLHIDGLNTAKAVKNDFTKFGTFVERGGFLIVHNIIVNELPILEDFLKHLNANGWKTVERADESVVLQKN